MDQAVTMDSRAQNDVKGWAYCPICTHVVQTPVKVTGRKIVVRPGQKCPRCGSALEAASVVRYEVAA